MVLFVTKEVDTPVQLRTLAAAIACIATYAVTLGLSFPLLSLILESHGHDRTVNGIVAAAPAIAMLVLMPTMLKLMGRLGMHRFLLLCIVADLVFFILLPVFDNPIAWFILRLLGGAAMAGLFLAGETWINMAVHDRIRGRVIGLYTTVVAGGMALGPLIIPLLGPPGWPAFITGGLFICLAALPVVMLGDSDEIVLQEDVRFNLWSFFLHAPTLSLAVLLTSFKDVSMFALLPVFGVRSGLDVNEAAAMLTVMGTGALCLQIPIGYMADHCNRYGVLILCGILGGIGTLLLPLVIGSPLLLWTLLFFWGGFFAGLYTMAMTILGDRYRGAELVTANAAFTFIWGLGSLCGPLVSGVAMDLNDPNGLIWTIAAACVLFVIIASARRLMRYTH